MGALTAVVITHNEEKNIGRCLRSLCRVADEIVVVDSFSTDATEALCAEAGARFVQRRWEGYAAAKNFGNSLASHDYILSIDADEELSPELEQSLLQAKHRLAGRYSFNRRTQYCGRWIWHCGWYPDTKVRLFDRRNTRWVGDYVHETLESQPDVPTVHLHGDLLHYSFQTISSHLEKINAYTSLAAAAMHRSGRRSSMLRAFTDLPVVFVQKYFLRQGWRDGFEGMVISLLSGYDKVVRQLKLQELERQAAGSGTQER